MPNGQNLIVSAVFGGLSFKPSDLSNHRSAFPPGWTVILNEEDPDDEQESEGDNDLTVPLRKHNIHRYKKPTLLTDHLFISSISNPSSAEFRPPTSPTRQIAMMLWATLWWYFHQPEPDRKLTNTASANTAEDGRPKGEWRININREGIFKGKNVLAKLERMGLIITEDSSVGTHLDDRDGFGFQKMFVTRRAFWQIDPRIYLFTLSPVTGSPFPSSSPFSSRPSSPRRGEGRDSPGREPHPHSVTPSGTMTPLIGPYQSTSHLPTYYPPHPVQYVFTNGIRHPLRPKPAKQGETIYMRYIPSVGQYLSFRIASLSHSAPNHVGPWSVTNALQSLGGMRTSGPHPAPNHTATCESLVPTMHNLGIGPNDVELLHTWMNDPRVAYSWGETGPTSHQEEFLRRGLASKHSFPVIGCWDGKPFGYFEIYWVKEDILGKYMGGECGNWDRGIHCLVGEQEFRGPHRVKIWLSALLHYCWLADMRTDTVMMEPRVDNVKYVYNGPASIDTMLILLVILDLQNIATKSGSTRSGKLHSHTSKPT